MTYEGYAFVALGVFSLAVGACESSGGGGNADAGSDGSATAAGGMPASGGASGAGGGGTGGDAEGGAGGGTGGRAGSGAGGGGAGTGGAIEAGAGDASSDASSGPGCAGRSYAFCEDFESAEDGELPPGWTKVNGWNQGEVVVTSSEHHTGQRALASAVAVNGQPRAGHSLTSLGATAGTHWGRIFYKVKCKSRNLI